MYYHSLQPAKQVIYSDNYDDYVKFELANKLISGNTHVICKIGKWIFVHGGMNTYVLDALKTHCIDDPAVQPEDYIAHINQQFHRFLKEQRTIIDLYTNSNNKCLKYVIENENSLLTTRYNGLAGTQTKYNSHVRISFDTCAITARAFGELLNNFGGPGNHLVVAHCVQNQSNYTSSVGQIYEFRRTPPLTASDADRLVFASPGLPNQVSEYMSGINYICPDTPDSKEGGTIWRVDCGMSRAFLADKGNHPIFSSNTNHSYWYSRSCRPQCLMIQNDRLNPGKYVTYVLLGKESLNIELALIKYNAIGNMPLLNHNDLYELNTQYVDDPIFGIPPPAQPVAAPVQPVAAPAQPVAAPVQPVAAPVQPVAAPAQPVAAPAQPVAASKGHKHRQRYKKQKSKTQAPQSGAAAAASSPINPTSHGQMQQPSSKKRNRRRKSKKGSNPASFSKAPGP